MQRERECAAWGELSKGRRGGREGRGGSGEAEEECFVRRRRRQKQNPQGAKRDSARAVQRRGGLGRTDGRSLERDSTEGGAAAADGQTNSIVRGTTTFVTSASMRVPYRNG